MRCDGFAYPGLPVERYKDEPGTWVAVTRRVLGGEGAAFEARYFELEPAGYTSFERHRHVHLVVVLRGRGRVRLGVEWADIGPGDVVRVSAGQPHQFVNPGEEPFGILCVVDKERDRPILLDSDGTPRT